MGRMAEFVDAAPPIVRGPRSYEAVLISALGCIAQTPLTTDAANHKGLCWLVVVSGEW